MATEGGSQCAAVAALSLSRRRATDLLLLPPTCATLPSKLILLRIVSNTNEQHSIFQNTLYLSIPPGPSRSESAIALFPNQKGTRRGPNFEKDGDLDNVKRGPKFEFFQIVHTEKSSRNQISNTEKHWGTVGMGLWEQYQRASRQVPPGQLPPGQVPLWTIPVTRVSDIIGGAVNLPPSSPHIVCF